MKKIGTLFLIVLISMPTWYALQLQLKQILVRIKMEVKLENQQLLTIRLQSNSVHWIIKGKEASIDNRLFDAKHSQTDGDFIELTGIYDAEETGILEKISKEEDEQKQRVLEMIPELDWWHYQCEAQTIGILPDLLKYFDFPFHNLIDTTLGQPTPPPEV